MLTSTGPSLHAPSSYTSFTTTISPKGPSLKTVGSPTVVIAEILANIRQIITNILAPFFIAFFLFLFPHLFI
jgi:hypothetical protein